jgi:two-component system phosphate regulon response regulator PhoB
MEQREAHDPSLRVAATRILVVEDTHVQAQMLARDLSREGFEVLLAAEGGEALARARAELPDLVVLDLGLPGKNGLDVCRELRAGAATREIPIIMASARSAETDQLVGFALGADDYVTKPYSTKVLIARIQSVLRRRRAVREAAQESLVERFGVAIDQYSHRAMHRGRELALTPTEYRLLEMLLRRPGRAFTRNELMDAAVGEDAEILEGTINAYINSLRRKLGDAADLIETVRGVGYRFRDSDPNEN